MLVIFMLSFCMVKDMKICFSDVFEPTTPPDSGEKPTSGFNSLKK